MTRLCSVCSHPQRRAIDAALIEHPVGLRRIAAAFGLSVSAIRRHQNEHLRARLEGRRECSTHRHSAARMAALDGHVNRVLGETRRDHRLVLLGVTEGRRTMDTLMRLLLIHQRGTSTRMHSSGGTSALQPALDCAARSGSPFPTREAEGQGDRG